MKVLKILMMMILTLSFVSGSIFGEDKPEESDISKKLILSIPSYLTVSDIDIGVSENTGTKVEPVYASRFKGVLETTESLYEIKSRILNKLVLVEKIPSGTKIKIHGITVSTLDGDKWKVRFKSLKIPTMNGKSISDFEVGSFVIFGSKEEENLKKQKVEQDKKEAEERKAREIKEAEERKAREIKEAEKAEKAEIKRIKDYKFITYILKSGEAIEGEAGEGTSIKWPFLLTFEDYDESKKTFSGKIEWLTLNGTTKIQGNLLGNKIIFKEVAHIKKGNVTLNTVYTMDTVQGEKISGIWNNNKNNWVWFKAKILNKKELKERELNRKKEAKNQEIRMESVSGIWKGAYYCGKKNDFVFTIKPVNEKLQATFEFKANTGVPGSFVLYGKIDKDYNMVFEPSGWIEQPSNYNMVGLRGKLNNKKDAFFGDIIGCEKFELYKLKE
jgi:predicted Holliday junction resolvase-like endonuclease